MKLVFLTALAVVATAHPDKRPQNNYYSAPKASSRSDFGRSDSFEAVDVVPILKDERVMEEDGRYNFEIETGDGIMISQFGSPDGPDGAVVKSGQHSYTAPDGTRIELSFVADENGYQPQGAHLPVAPEFPHEIPQFVLDQIAFAAEEDAAAARAESRDFRSEATAPSPSQTYGR